MGLDMSLSRKTENKHFELIYWRKNWVIHEWFVNKLNITDNESYPVTRYQIHELIDYLNTLKEDEDWLVYCIGELKEIILEYPDNQTFYYTASW